MTTIRITPTGLFAECATCPWSLESEGRDESSRGWVAAKVNQHNNEHGDET